MDPILAYLKNGEVPKGNTEAHILQLKTTRYVLYDDKLYQRGYSMSFLKCVPPSEVKYIIKEIHEGICGNHVVRQSLTFKTLRQGYYWPKMKADCMEFAQRCDKCQRFSLISKAHLEEHTTMTCLWPFTVWGIDLIGQLPKGRGSVQYAVVAIDYFTKWIKAEALVPITPAKIKEFMYKNIICQYGVPHTIISDNTK